MLDLLELRLVLRLAPFSEPPLLVDVHKLRFKIALELGEWYEIHQLLALCKSKLTMLISK